jgi:post-segregation antitoxin (ccd killing protein)
MVRAMNLAEQEARDQGAQKWLEENRAAIESWNDWVTQHGMPYDEYRQLP